MAIKITSESIDYGPTDPDEFESIFFAKQLIDAGYRKVSSAYCRIARIDRDDWIEVLATQMHCAPADFYNRDGSGVSNRQRDYYIRSLSRDILTVAPAIIRKIPTY